MSIGDTEGSTEIVLRQYQRHITVFTKAVTTIDDFDNYKDKTYGMFSFNTDRDRMTYAQKEEYDHIENPFHDFEHAFPDILRLVNENKLQSLWNTRDLPRPDYVDVQTGFYGEEIRSLDLFIFGSEELSTMHVELFAENQMFDTLKELKAIDVIGENFGTGIISAINTEFPKQYSEPYYHAIGIQIVEPDDRKSFQDVYSLTRYYLKDINQLYQARK
jgi:hypothetical protein